MRSVCTVGIRYQNVLATTSITVHTAPAPMKRVQGSSPRESSREENVGSPTLSCRGWQRSSELAILFYLTGEAWVNLRGRVRFLSRLEFAFFLLFRDLQYSDFAKNKNTSFRSARSQQPLHHRPWIPDICYGSPEFVLDIRSTRGAENLLRTVELRRWLRSSWAGSRALPHPSSAYDSKPSTCRAQSFQRLFASAGVPPNSRCSSLPSVPFF